MMIKVKKLSAIMLVHSLMAAYGLQADAAPALPELQPNIPRPDAPRATPVPTVPAELPANAVRNKKSTVKVVVGAFSFTGNKQFSSETLAAQLEGFTGREIGMRELNEAIAIIRNYYRDRGYLLAQVYLPPQDLQKTTDATATVELAVLEGTLGSVKVESGERIDQSYMQHMAEYGLKSGETLSERSLVRNLMIINSLPGVTATSQLNPGEAVGSSDVVIAVEPKPAFNGYAKFNTYGNRYTGREVMSFGLAYNNPAGRGDQFAVLGKISNDEGQRSLGAFYVLPVSDAGTMLNLSYNYVDYKLGREFKALKANGEASYFSAALEHPLIRDTKTGVSFKLGGNYKVLDDDVDSFPLNNRRNIASLDIGFVGDWINAAGNVVYQWTATLTPGRISYKSTDAVTFFDTDKRFLKWNLGTSRTQYFENGVNWILRADYQGARNNLDIAERFGIGAINRWRSYAELPSQADEGWMVGNDVRKTIVISNPSPERWLQSMTPFAFYDYGHGKFNHDPATSDNTIRSTHFGAGVDLQYVNQWLFSASLSRQKRDAEGVETQAESRFWAQISKSF